MIRADKYDGDCGSSSPMLESHSHDYYELSFVIEGDLTILFDRRHYAFKGNCVILSPPKAAHHIIVGESRYFRYNIYFFKAAFGAELGWADKLEDLFVPGGCAVSLSADAVSRIQSAATLMIAEEKDENKVLLLRFILNVIASERGKSAPGELPASYIDNVMRIVLNEYSSKLLAADLARRCFIGRTKLMTDFKNKTGKTLLEYITFVRLEHAKDALRAGKSVYETAVVCGFVNAANFTRVFKNTLGITPREYKSSHGKVE